MKRVFVVTDIHSCYTPLKQLLDYANFNDSDTLVINGDLFDRGTEAKELFGFLLSNKDNVVYLKGNHEELVELYDKGNMSWIISGGSPTLEFINTGELVSLDSYLSLIKTLPNEFICNNYLITHAWINDVWDRTHTQSIIRDKLYSGTINMIVGHTPMNLILNKDITDIIKDKDYIVFNDNNCFINLDFGTYSTKVMGMIEINSETIYFNSFGNISVQKFREII